jgi:hypothetical protein
MRLFENRGAEENIGRQGDDIKEEWSRLHNEELLKKKYRAFHNVLRDYKRL